MQKRTMMTWAAAFALGTLPAQAAWNIENLAEQVQDCSHLVASDGVHIAYTTYGGLAYLHRAPGGAWTYEGLGQGHTTEVDLRLGPNGVPRIASSYDNYLIPEGALRFSDRTGGSWTTTDAALRFSSSPSLAFGGAGTPSIAFVDDTTSQLFLAQQPGASWTVQQLTNNTVQSASAVYDRAGRLHIVYVDLQEKKLKHARFDGFNWQFQVVDVLGDHAAGRPSLATNAQGPHVTVAYTVGHLLMVADWRQASAAWTAEMVDVLEWPGASVSLKAGQAGGHHLAYAASSQEVRYGHRASGVWSVEPVEESLTAGVYDVSLALDTLGRPTVAYVMHDGIFQLKYAVREAELAEP